MSLVSVVEVSLPPEPTAPGRARRAVREALTGCGAMHLVDRALVAVSELVTNAVVHAGTPVELRVTAESGAVRVEIEDSNRRLPVRREWATTAGTGRGLVMVDELVDRWDAELTARGKVVWFEIGSPGVALTVDDTATDPSAQKLVVTLRRVPLLMHSAWQEHASALLREYMLYSLEENPEALEEHAHASDALSLLSAHIPAPQLPTDAADLLASVVEPGVTAAEVVLSVPLGSVHHFGVLEELVVRAVRAAEDGELLGFATQPEIRKMRTWLCSEVARQADHHAPSPWVPPTLARTHAGADGGRSRASVRTEVSGWTAPVIATDDTSVIVAVSPHVAGLLGYRDESLLLGQRVLVVIPERLHQAYVAGATLIAANGGDVLLGTWLTVPLLRADGSEVSVPVRLEQRRLHDRRIIVAELRLDP